ncbi:ATP-binding protein [Actinoplanes sp. NPDC049548]|uniref:sensor histidine kinase n=1 Tax=Actinoplanes sp. NPDC049548 TaxID=3155152 RepID=UPI00342F191F
MRVRRREPPTDPALVLLRSFCHELRPPVATLTSLVRALEHQQTEGRREELAQLAAAHVSHAEAVLQQAAAAAQGLAGPADNHQPLHRVLPSVAATVPRERLDVEVSAAAARCVVAPRHTRQILLNLLDNAERYSPGAIRLSARTGWRRLRLTVSDEGSFTLDLARSLRRRTPPQGTKGLGLWVVRHLVAAQGGVIRARPLTPRGVAIEVCLPRRRR